MVKKSKRPTERRKVARAFIRRASDSDKTFEALEKDIEASGGRKTKPGKLAVDRQQIVTAEQVFQWRSGTESRGRERDRHIQTLTAALRDTGRPLPHLLVMPVGDLLYVIDGHHRLSAYDNAEWTRKIPVEVFSGTLREARHRALDGNSKDKLPMTFNEKLEAAWQIVKAGGEGLSAKATADLAGVSRRTVNRMRRAWEQIEELKTSATNGDEKAKGRLERLGDLEKLRWRRGHWVDGAFDDDDKFDVEEWRQQKADELVRKLVAHDIAPLMTKELETTAKAMAAVVGAGLEDLILCLVDEWQAEADDNDTENLMARIRMTSGQITAEDRRRSTVAWEPEPTL
jgi:Homeodomain-like domain/ParB-like nuclease domain